VDLAFGGRHTRHSSQLLPDCLLAVRRLLRESIDGLADGILLLGWKLVQPVVNVLQRLLLFGRELIEFLQALLQPLPLLRWQTVERLLLFGRRHCFEFFDRSLGALALPLGARGTGCHPAAPPLCPSCWAEEHAARQGAQRQNRAATEHRSALDLLPWSGLLEEDFDIGLLQQVHVIQCAFHLLDLKFRLRLLL